MFVIVSLKDQNQGDYSFLPMPTEVRRPIATSVQTVYPIKDFLVMGYHDISTGGHNWYEFFDKQTRKGEKILS